MADDLIIHTFSQHTDNNHDSVQTWETTGARGQRVTHSREVAAYNNLNFGLGYSWDSGLSVGMYYNSFERPTAYVAQEWMPFEHFGVFGGLATGYDSMTGKPITAIGGFIIRAPLFERYTANILITPPINNKTHGVVHLAILKKF
jgi:hypothetical protein